MKRQLLALLFAFGFLAVNAQSFQFHDQSGNNLSGQTVTLTGDDSEYELTDYIKLMNNSGTSKNIKIKRYEVSVTPATTNYFCWTVCYAPMTAGAYPQFPYVGHLAWNDYVTASGSAYAPYQLIVYHKPNGNAGNSLYRYVAFDGANPNDSVEVFVAVNISAANSVNELFAVKSLNLFPNPANQVANIHYQFNNAAGEQQLVVSDMIGNRRKVMQLIGTEGTVRLDLNEYASGIYFVTVMRNGEAVSTKRLVVTH